MSDYGFLHTARVVSQDVASGGWYVQSVSLARDRRWGPIPSCVAGLQAGDKVVLAATGTTRDNLLIVAALDPRYPDIGDIPGLQAALDLKANAADLTAFQTVTNASLLTITNKNTEQDGRLTTVEGRATALEGRATALEAADVSLDSRLDTAESTLTSHGTRLTTAETNITALQARKTKVIAHIAASTSPTNFWTNFITTANSTTYVVAQYAIADPGWSYYVSGVANLMISGATGGPYSHEMTMRVGNNTSPSVHSNDIVCHNFMRTIDGGVATFSASGSSPTIWSGAQTVYLIVRCGVTGVFNMGNWSTHKNYAFDLTLTPA